MDIEVLLGLKKLLLGWGIEPDNWYVTGEAAMIISDYPIEFRDKQIDILVCRKNWPWEKPEEEVSLFPPINSKEDKELKDFIEKYQITPDFHPLPHVGLRVEDRFDHTYLYPNENGVRVLAPWAGIYHRKCIVEFYENDVDLSLAVFDQNKFIRWKKFVKEVREYAKEKNDSKTIEMCNMTLPVIDRAVNFFDFDNLKNEPGILRGISVNPGRIIGEVMIWDENKDCRDKIVVLKHALPYQFSKLSNVKGIITDEGGTLSHAAIIAREYNIPCIIATKNATQVLKDKDKVEVNADEGTVKKII